PQNPYLSVCVRGSIPYGPVLLLDFLNFDESVQLPNAGRVPHFAQRLGFDLTNSLARHSKLLADFLEGARVAVPKAEPQLEHLAFAFGKAAQDITQLILQQAEAGHLGWTFGRFILDEIAEAGVLAVAYRRLKRDGLLGHLQHRANALDRQLHL